MFSCICELAFSCVAYSGPITTSPSEFFTFSVPLLRTTLSSNCTSTFCMPFTRTDS